ncbi:MAG TPA: SDR family oxidoreductase [Candidatus Bathyarchaeia archaeon]|nr:SDR family oxidoreductase [Candidatus Bathyarchaeia archaeon]
MSHSLKGKVVLVTASSKGIGLGVARVCASQGAKLAISSRSSANLKAAKKLIIEESGAEVLAIKADISVKKDALKIVRQTLAAFDGLDVLVHNAGPPRSGSIMDLNDSDWGYAIRMLLLSPIWFTKATLPAMLRKKQGRLIYLTSVSLKEPIPNLMLSNTVRIGVAGLVKSLATEFGQSGVTANGVMPGYIDTDRVNDLARVQAKKTGKRFSQILNGYVGEVPVRRLGTPEEVGHVVAFLASDAASYINGSMITVDGGLLRSIL